MHNAAAARPMVREMCIVPYRRPERRFALAAGHAVTIGPEPIKQRPRPVIEAEPQMSQFIQCKPARRNTGIIVALAETRFSFSDRALAALPLS
jgi:hypothetical protein